jgi:hypothetical protein
MARLASRLLSEADAGNLRLAVGAGRDIMPIEARAVEPGNPSTVAMPSAEATCARQGGPLTSPMA